VYAVLAEGVVCDNAIDVLPDRVLNNLERVSFAASLFE
jgi:hypothetical protein